MKIKNLFITLGLALAAVGVAAGVGTANSSAKEANALSAGEDIYLDASNWGYGDVRIAMYTWKEGGSSAWTTMTKVDEDHGVFTAEIPSTHEKVIFCRMNTNYATNSWNTDTEKDHVFNQTGDIILSAAGVGQDTYYISGFDFSGNEWRTFADDYDLSADDGYYLFGDSAFMSEMGTTGTAWHLDSAVKMNAASGGNYASYIITVNNAVEVRVRHYEGGHAYWRNFDNSVFDAAEITKDGYNAQLAAGTYTLYVNNENVVYIAVGMPLDAFVDGFLSDMALICGTTSGEWNNNHAGTALNKTWALYLNRYENALSSDDITTFKTSGDAKIVQARTLYAHCVDRYKLTEWAGGPTLSPRITSIATETTAIDNTTLIIVLASVITLAAVGGYFLLRKKED